MRLLQEVYLIRGWKRLLVCCRLNGKGKMQMAKNRE